MKLRVLIIMFVVLTCRAMADGKGVAHIPLPADLTGTLDGADYIIRVPANWNGTLLVFAHPNNPLGLVVTQAAPVSFPKVTPSLEKQLLGLGYAIAGSGFQNTDKDGMLRTLSLTNFFRGMVGNPGRIIVWGNSLGGKIALKLIEEYPGVYDGAIGISPPAAGTPENLDSALSFGLAYAAAFGWHDELWGPIEDLRDDLDFWADVLPLLQAETWPSPATYGRWEFIRLVMHQPPEAFWGINPSNGNEFFAVNMWKATQNRAAAEALYGGPVATNVGIQYTLTEQDKLYLDSLGVNADELLAYMNARTNITADIAARNHVEHWGGLSGRLSRPVLTMHAIFDGQAFISHESYYAALVQEAGSSDLLVQAYVNAVGHCSFSADQYLSVLGAMNSWLDTGVRPDASLLPASKGFNLGFVPPLWPF
ncbi:MAG TPA: alpha/beta hydrolase [Acidobacteriota bacterium]|nr:alpha/beta hydrolase [Acidobacteriota bacterium]